MALIDLIKVSKKYDSKILLKEASLNIFEKDKICLIGQNGSGKSTLINIIKQKVEVDDGKVIVGNKLKINYLEQEPTFKHSQSVYEYLQDTLSHLKEIKQKFDDINKKLETSSDMSLINESSKLASMLDYHDGWDLTNRLDRIIEQFSLTSLQKKSMSLLSGGEKRRVALAGLLLKESDILILDEPTNHLDVYMVKFLEDVLANSNYTILFVSHDRYFIDNVASRVVEIDDGNLREFKGGYSDYIRAKQELLRVKEKEQSNMLKILKGEEEWLAKGVRARRKRNEGRKERLMKLREEAKKNPSEIRKMKIQLQREKHNFQQNDEKISKKKVFFEIEKLSITLGKKSLISDFSTRILQKDKIAIVGKNGSGKSTLLKAMLNQIEYKGNIKRGEFTVGYFDQSKNSLDNNKTLIETFCPDGGDRVDYNGSNIHVYGYLKNFLFPKEFLTKKIGMLSGGEKTRVALALILSKKYDVLILDEPTNDLDISTINIIEEALAKFVGALIFVSHDRYFVDKLAKKLFAIETSGHIEEVVIDYSEYLNIEQNMNYIEDMQSEYANKPQKIQEKNKIQENTKKKLSYKEKLEFEELEKLVPTLEKEIKELNDCLADPKCYQKKSLQELSSDLAVLNDTYNIKVERYLYLMDYM